MMSIDMNGEIASGGGGASLCLLIHGIDRGPRFDGCGPGEPIQSQAGEPGHAQGCAGPVLELLIGWRLRPQAGWSRRSSDAPHEPAERSRTSTAPQLHPYPGRGPSTS